MIGLAARLLAELRPGRSPLGDCAAIRVGGIEVVLITKPHAGARARALHQPRHRPTQKKLLVVKSTNHFMAAFGPIAKKVLYVDSDAPLSRDYRKVPYTRVQRPIWPLDEGTSPGLIF